MKRQPWILAGTALGLLMVSAPLGAYPLQSAPANDVARIPGLVLAQADCAQDASAEGCATGNEQKPRRKDRKQQADQAEQAAPAAEQQQQQQEATPAPEEQKQRKKNRKQQADQAEQAAPAAEQQQQQEAAPAPEEQKQRKKNRKQQADQAEQAAPAAEQQQQQEAAPAAEEQKPRKKKNKDQAKPAEQAAPAAEQQQEVAPAAEEQKPRKKKNRDQAKPAAAEEATPSPKPEQEAVPAEQTTPEAAPAPKPAPDTQTKADKRKQKQPASEQQPETGQQPAAGEQETPAQAGQQGEAPADPNAAPILDSQKDLRRERKGDKNGKRDGKRQQDQAGGEQSATPPAVVDQGPPPANDKAAQQAIRPEKIEPVTEEKGKRREKAPDRRRGERREGIDVLKEIGDRVIFQLGGQTMVESTDRSRMTHGASDVYYEDLPRGRTRETIERGNGDRVVTIRNRNGDIIQRSRITRDGREYVLNYVDEKHYDDQREWRDPGDDLPPMRLNIPRNQYILDSESVEDPDAYYDFLEQPPVERVQRLYSVQEVKRSARVRDIARRIDLDTLTFEFGSASISDSEVQKLEGVANAMERLLKKNPAETFLIEGHTDAVGSEDANLALSDRRAEAVAEALTNAFGIPPENLSTQGYGEEYLKVNTTAPERQNRRVAIRRITSLVAPVASAD